MMNRWMPFLICLHCLNMIHWRCPFTIHRNATDVTNLKAFYIDSSTNLRNCKCINEHLWNRGAVHRYRPLVVSNSRHTKINEPLHFRHLSDTLIKSSLHKHVKDRLHQKLRRLVNLFLILWHECLWDKISFRNCLRVISAKIIVTLTVMQLFKWLDDSSVLDVMTFKN